MFGRSLALVCLRHLAPADLPVDLSKAEAGKMTLHVEEFDMAKRVREVEATLQPLIAKNANSLEVSCASDVRTMRADQTKERKCYST